MKNTTYKLNHDTVILDFPDAETIAVDSIDFNKSENASLYISSDEDKLTLSTPKNIINWQKVDHSKLSPLTSISKDQNFLFKGNNLIGLYSLLPVFQNSVKLIYIDPPYNTGNTFTYKDKFSRSKWLLFMKNRLSIAREFLNDDGILVVQCDEKEHAYLKVLLDELYGEEQFIGSVTVLTNPSGRDYRSLARMHEYLLIYGKTSQAELFPLTLQKDFPYTDEMGDFELRSLNNGNIRFHLGNRPNLCYPFYVNPKKHDDNKHHEVSLIKKKSWIEVWPRVSQGIQTVWRWGRAKAEQNINSNPWKSELVARASKDSFLIFEKYRKKTRLARTVWSEKDFYTSKGTKQLKTIFQDSVFDYPKPELLIARIIDLATKEGDRVMDFFLGSGTTVAVAHKAKRKWIGIEQMPYIHTVTIPRLQAVLKGEDGGASNAYNWTGGGEFVYGEFESCKQFPFYTNVPDHDNSLTSKFYQL